MTEAAQNIEEVSDVQIDIEEQSLAKAETAMQKSAEAAAALADATKEREEEARWRLQHVRDIAERENEVYIELAEELHAISKKALFHHMTNPMTGEKYSSFKEFAQQETWFGSERTASYLIAIWEYYVVQEGEGDRALLDSIKHLGWTKLREMIGYLDTDNVDDVMRVVDGPDGQMSKDNIISMVREHKALQDPVSNSKQQAVRKLPDEEGPSQDPSKDPAAGPSPSDTSRDKLSDVKFRLYEHQKSNVEIAVEKAKNIRGSESDAEALDIIALEFISLHASDDKESVTDILTAVEGSLGGTLVLFKRDGAYYLGRGKESGDKRSERVESLFKAIEDQMDVTVSVIKDGKLIYAPGLDKDDSDISQLSNTLAAMEEAVGVKLMAYKDGDFLYGADTLRSLAKK